MDRKRLLIVSSLPAARIDAETVAITRKFISGVVAHQKLWPGDVDVVMEPGNSIGDNLDYVESRVSDLPFKLTVAPFDSEDVRREIGRAGLVLLMLYQDHLGLARYCASASVPHILVSEYSLRTRIQINASQRRNPAWLAAKMALEAYREMQFRRAVRDADGMQCNGTPTYQAYAPLNSNTLLFFDTRTAARNIASGAHLSARFAARRAGGRLRLAFSGRLIAMKGADQLIDLAIALKAIGMPFHLTICGDGEQLSGMKRRTAESGLADDVAFAGTLDFAEELVPFIQDEVDLFVCCHPQGDPSCTYLETMACGVPIVGYDNEAFSGVADRSGSGWKVPINDPAAMAMKVASLTGDEIESHSRSALAFAAERTFESEFARRIEHARTIADS